MKLSDREYRLLDFIKIPFAISHLTVLVQIFDKLITALIPYLQVLATAAFIDTAICIFNAQADRGAIVKPLVCLLLLITYQYATAALVGLAKAKMEIDLTEVFRNMVVEKRALLEYRHVENNDTWDLVERVGKDPAERLSGGFGSVLRMADMVIRLGSLMLLLMTQVWWAAIVIIAFAAPLFWLAIKSGETNYKAKQEAARHTRRASYLQGVLTGRDNIEERAVFDYTDELNERYYEKYDAAYKLIFKAEMRRFIRMKSASVIVVFIAMLIAGVLIGPLRAGEITTGMFMGLVTAAISLTHLMSWILTNITSELSTNREYLRDLSAFSALSEKQGAEELPASLMPEPQCIEFRNVSFAYPDTSVMILEGFSIKLYANKHYAFVGANGAGKTTITKLLTGLYDNYTGDISVDDKNLRLFTQAELKALFSVVYQDFARYQIAIKDSIGLGDVLTLLSEPECDKAASEAVNTIGLGDVAKKLPNGLNTPLGKVKKGGVDLSGGQWQRVAIARSLLSRAPIHILDEPTAALDPVAESEVYRLFGAVSKGKSTIFITHRLGAAKLADEIFVIDGGRVAEHGNHNKLMERGGMYAEMFEAQKGWYA